MSTDFGEGKRLLEAAGTEWTRANYQDAMIASTMAIGYLLADIAEEISALNANVRRFKGDLEKLLKELRRLNNLVDYTSDLLER